jgi:membrane protease subunit (stomatin/prohibitin family)
MAIIDVVRWQYTGTETLYAWKYPETNLSTFTQLIVDESKEAVLFSKGRIIGKFGPGKHTLNTENLPLLRNLFGLPFGGKNPFTAEVWFVNKLMPLNIDWSTDSMYYQDPEYGAMVPLVATGRYGLRLDDAERFLIKLVGTAANYTASQLTDQFWGALVAKTKTTLMQFMQTQRVSIKNIAAYLEPLSENLKASMLAFWEDFGFSLVGFYVTNIEIDSASEAGKRILDAMARQSAQLIGGYTWQQSQAFEVADRAASSIGGGGGGGGLLGSVIATGMLTNLGNNGLMQQPAPVGAGVPAQPGAVTLPVRDVFCSNCAKKFSSAMQFCPHCGDAYRPCPRCGADNDANAKRCVSCGTPLAADGVSCKNCSSPVPAGAAFCPKCGTPAQNINGCKRCGYQLKGEAFCPQCGLKAN